MYLFRHADRPTRARRALFFVLLPLAAALVILARPAGPTARYAAYAGPAATLAYSTYLGGGGADEAAAVALGPGGHIYVLGKTASADFLGYDTTPAGYSDLYVARFDPTGATLEYLSLIGSSDSDTPLGLAVDAQGNAYATALNYADDFPTLNALWTEYPHFSHDGALFKLDPNGNFVYSTLLPLDLFDGRHNVAADAQGNAYVTGTDYTQEGTDQIALLKIGPGGAPLLLEEYVGGPDSEKGRAVAVGGDGQIYLAGTTGNGDSFPVTADAHQPECGDMTYGDNFYCYEDGVVVVLAPDGQVVYSSHYGGSFTDEPEAIAVDGAGRIFVAGNTASGVFPTVNALQATCPIDAASGECRTARGFAGLIDREPGGAALVYSTYLGSAESDSVTAVKAAAINAGGQATISGYTNGRQFPVLNPTQSQLALGFCETFGSERYCFDAFAVTLSPVGALAFGTYLGGAFDEFGFGAAVGSNGAIYLAGLTESSDFPTTANAFQPNNTLGDDAYLTRINSGVAPPPLPYGDYNAFVPAVIR